MINIDNLIEETNELLEHIVKEDNGYVIYNKDKTKKLSKPYPNKREALKRLREIEYFKWNH
jgi:hypothetical protein